jgi:uncharacterized lipoprotein YmbA
MMRHAIACMLAAGVAACASPPSHFYTLSAVAPQASAQSKVAIAVGPVTIPPAIDRPQIVVTTGPNQVALDDFNRWASPVQDNLVRVVADNLTAILGAPRVTLYPTIATDVDFRVQIEVRNFESAPGKSAALDAVWTVRRIKDGKSETGRTSVRETIDGGESYDALAAAHSRAIAKMSQQIADAVRALERPAS